MFRISLAVLIALFIFKCNGDYDHSLADFGISLFQLSSQPGKQVISPVTESVALGAVYEGSRDETRKEIGDALFGRWTEGKVNFDFGVSYLHSIPKNVSYFGDRQVSAMGMLLLTHKRLKYTNEFLRSMKKNYNAVVKKYDFCNEKSLDKAVADTERWVDSATDGYVVGTVTKNLFRKDFRSSPVSTIFAGFSWKNPLTKQRGKFGGDKDHFLKGRGEYYYKTTKLYEMIGMEMADNAAVLYIFLPKGDYNAFEKEMDGVRILQAKFAEKIEVEVKIPEMKISSKYKFNDALQKLGIRKIFTEDAELGGISKQPLDMYAAYQCLHFEVNEEGVRAGSTGTAGLQSLSGTVDPPVEKVAESGDKEYEEGKGTTKKFVANRPFFFALVRNKVILFAGRYM